MYESLEHRLAVAEAAQRLRLPLLSQDGEVHEQEIKKLSNFSRSSFDSTLTSATPSSSSISTSYNNYSSTASAVTVAAAHGSGSSDAVEPGVGGVPDRFLGITSDYLYQVQQEQPAMSVVRTFFFCLNGQFIPCYLFDLMNVILICTLRSAKLFCNQLLDYDVFYPFGQ